MLTWIEQLAIAVVSTLLKQVIKNPAAYSTLEAVIQEVRDVSTLALCAINPSAPPPPACFAPTPTAKTPQSSASGSVTKL